jgi:hypothetical protein
VKQKRFHEIGTDRGARLFEVCGDDDDARIYRLERAQSGKPVPLGGKLVTLKPDRDGEHFQIDEIDLSGPARVSTPAYRKGWEQTFGVLN